MCAKTHSTTIPTVSHFRPLLFSTQTKTAHHKKMADDEEAGCKVEYLDTADGTPEETNWIMRAGRARVTYPNGCTFEGKDYFCCCLIPCS
jgi:hypothetical protein